MFLEQYKDYSSVVLRVLLGLSFILAGGLFKLTHLEPVSGMFNGLFGGAGTILLWITIIVEIVGGLFLLIGYHTRWTATVLAVVMLVAFFKTFNIASGDFLFTLKEIFVFNTGGGNTATSFAYFAGLLSLALGGSKTMAVKPE